MTVDDLLLGDSPWRARCQVNRRPLTRTRAVVMVVLALVAVVPLTPVVPALVAAVVFIAVGWSAEVRLSDGGHRPLGSRDVASWLAFDDLDRIDREAAQAEAATKARARR